ncbi:killer cell lectin-like receptor subfamily B member 1A [Homarus americanus]|uniref:C-type lectin-like 38 n=1 Tax=Homarus americanus TaxID=6706 RepID=A0A8J5MBX3_HOMAM|nr:killer cell lectin-like receptor subfamily B member 1A [Homarus americanus]KAG7153263.1 C-type lectin-like 38 [Homarus americanus]
MVAKMTGLWTSQTLFVIIVVAMASGKVVVMGDEGEEDKSEEFLVNTLIINGGGASIYFRGVPPTASQPRPCPYPFTQVMDECFYLSKKEVSWDRSLQHCRGMGAYLAIPRHLYALNSFIIRTEKLENGYYVQVWLGGKKQADGRWAWLNEETLNEEDWSSKHSETSPGSDCLYCMNIPNVNDQPLLSGNCNATMRFVCQVKLENE